MQVTARELKLRLGSYLKAVRSGEVVRVTLRGRAVAELRPVGPPTGSRLDQLLAAGLATPAKGKLEPHTPSLAARSGTALILTDRESDPG